MTDQNKNLNPIAKFVKLYQTVTINPLVHAALLTWGTSHLAKKAIPKIQKLVQKAALTATGKADDPKAIQQAQTIAQQQAQLMKNNPWIPWGFGAIVGALNLAGNTNFNKQYNGWLSWNPMDKTANLHKEASFWQSVGYQPNFKFNQVVDTQAVYDIFKTNPVLRDDSYVRNFGTSIVAAAPKIDYQNTTLGGIYDSAMNKFQNKLTLHGIAKQGVKSVVAGSLAGLFTDTVGTVMGLPASVRAPVTKSVSLGSALYSILT